MSIDSLFEKLEGKDLAESLSEVSKLFPGKAVFSTAFGREGQVVLDTIFKNDLDIDVFTIDTGRLFNETYELMDRVRSRYQKSFKVYFPNAQSVEELTSAKGFSSFYQSVDNRKECCYIRKVEPLERALKGAKIWVTGLRAGQSDNRKGFEKIEWDERHGVFKFNPLLDCSFEEVERYLKENNVPVNALHKKGFTSIGCAPCTRAILEGEDSRAGRWWWEDSKKECGLHDRQVILK